MNKLHLLSSAILITSLGLTGCGDDDDSSTTANPSTQEVNNPESTAQKEVVTGIITDTNGNPLSNATIRVGDKEVTSNTNGQYSLELNDTDTDFTVMVKMDGYLTTARQIKRLSKGTYKVDINLSADQVSTEFDNSAGINKLLVSGATVTIPSNAVVKADGTAYNGNVKIAANYYNPDSVEGAQAFAQPYLGQDADGSDETGLVTVGVIEVKLTDPITGDKLDLKEGASATLTFPEASTDQDLATIPLWYYDEEEFIWVKDGVAVRQTDGSYQGEVTHFTLWNVDIPVGQYPALLEGCFIDQETKERKTGGVYATIIGRGFKNSGSIDTEGNFSVQVPMNTPLTLVPSIGYNTFNPIEIPALAQNAEYKINGGQCIETTENSYDEIFTTLNEITQTLPEAPIFVTPNPEPITPVTPIQFPLEQNKEGIIGYGFEIDFDSDFELENVYLNTSQSLTNSVIYSFESLYRKGNYGSTDFEKESESYMLTRQGLSQQSSVSILDNNKIRFEILNTTVRGNQLINTLDNGFRGVLTLNDKSLSGLKIGDVLSYNISPEDFPNSIVSKINDLPFSKGTFSGSASCKVIRSVQANVDNILFSSPGYNANFDEEARLLDLNPTKGTWANIPWASTNEPDDYDTYETIVKYGDLIYNGDYTKSGFEKLSVEDQNTCELYNEAAKDQILEALAEAYPAL